MDTQVKIKTLKKYVHTVGKKEEFPVAKLYAEGSISANFNKECLIRQEYRDVDWVMNAALAKYFKDSELDFFVYSHVMKEVVWRRKPSGELYVREGKPICEFFLDLSKLTQEPNFKIEGIITSDELRTLKPFKPVRWTQKELKENKEKGNPLNPKKSPPPDYVDNREIRVNLTVKLEQTYIDRRVDKRKKEFFIQKIGEHLPLVGYSKEEMKFYNKGEHFYLTEYSNALRLNRDAEVNKLMEEQRVAEEKTFSVDVFASDKKKKEKEKTREKDSGGSHASVFD